MSNYRHWKIQYPASEDILVVWILHKLFIFKAAPLSRNTLLLKMFKNTINKKVTITDDRVLLKMLQCKNSCVIMVYGTMWCHMTSPPFFFFTLEVKSLSAFTVMSKFWWLFSGCYVYALSTISYLLRSVLTNLPKIQVLIWIMLTSTAQVTSL